MFSVFGASWGALGALLGTLGRSWGALGALLGRLGTLLGRFWPLLGRPWGAFGESWDALETLLGASWALLGASCGKYRKNLECDPFVEAILKPKMEAKITQNRIKKTMCFSWHDFNVFCRFLTFCHAR